jgi:multiple sugar transport system substrate-binding protein
MMKAAKILVLIVIGLVVLVGCGGSGGEKPRAGNKKTKISLFTWTRPEELKQNQQLVDEFMQNHPDIEVELQNEPSQGAMDKLQTRISARNAPDVMSIHGAYFIPLADKGALLDLGPYVTEKDFELNDFYPQLVDLCKWNGKLYSLPRYTSIYVLFYNKDLFDAAKLKYPDETWTWDTYLAAAQKMTHPVAGGKQQFGCLIQFWGARLYPWLWQNGGDLLDKNRKKCTIDSPACRQALQFLVDLRYKYKVTPATSASNTPQDLAMFTSGQVGMMMTGAWDIQNMNAAPKLRWDIAPLPKKKERASLLGMENYAISATTEHPKEAWELFKFLLGKHAQEVMGNTLEKQPSRQSVANGPYLSAKASYNRRVLVDALQYAHVAPNVPYWERIRPKIDEPQELIWLGKLSVDEGTKKICQGVDAELNKN